MILGDLLQKTWCNTIIHVCSKKYGNKVAFCNVLRETRPELMREFVDEIDVIKDEIERPKLFVRLFR